MPTRSEADLNGDGKPDLVVSYANGRKTEQREDRNFDGKDDVLTLFDADGNARRRCARTRTRTACSTPRTFFERRREDPHREGPQRGRPPDLVAFYAGGKIVRQEEDSNFDGQVDRKSETGEKGTQVQEADTNGDGRIDTWITTDASGAVIKKDEDRSGDGKPDLSAWFEGGKLARLEQDTKGAGCVDLRQWFDAREKVSAEYTRHQRRLQDRRLELLRERRAGAPGPRHERRRSARRAEPARRAGPRARAGGRRAAATARARTSACSSTRTGQVVAQCLLGEDKKKLNTRALVKGGVVVEVLIDSSGKGFADTRQVLSKTGEVVRVEADTNADRKPDVVQTYEGGALAFQDEDTNFDGAIDQRFQGTTPVAVPAGARVPDEPFGKLDCGSFDRFWWKR